MTNKYSLKDLREELFTHVSDNPTDVAAFKLWLVKRHDDEVANRKDLTKFMKTARELGITVSPELLDLPSYYVLSIKTTLQALATLVENNHDIENIVVPNQTIMLN